MAANSSDLSPFLVIFYSSQAVLFWVVIFSHFDSDFFRVAEILQTLDSDRNLCYLVILVL